MGSVIALSNAAGAVAASFTHGPYGETANPSGTAFRYTGRRIDPETGLYYYRARYYSPNLGRFMQTDPIGYQGGINLYAYVGNSPTFLSDPSGNFGWVGFGIGLVSGASAGYVAGGFWGAVLGGAVGGVIGIGAPSASAAAGTFVAGVTGSTTAGGVAGGATFVGLGGFSGGASTVGTNIFVTGKPWNDSVGTGVAIGALSTIGSGEAGLVGYGITRGFALPSATRSSLSLAEQAGLPAVTNGLLSVQTGLLGALGAVATEEQITGARAFVV